MTDQSTLSTRPLPQPSLSTREYWTSGEDGTLRVSQCGDCGQRMMPPLPICSSCRGRDISMQGVSGRGTVAAFSINAQAWLPSFPPPYVVAIIALDEDDSVRITTNVVNCDVTDVHIGQRVRVLFEQADDVWIPLFEPDPDAAGEPGPVPEPRDYKKALRPMASPHKFEDKVAITGVGQSRIGRRLMVDPLSLTMDAALQAIADAGLTPEDIDGLSTYPGPGLDGMTEGGVTAVEEALRIHPVWVNGASETPGQNGSIITAMMAVASGLVRHVLCFRTVWQASLAGMERGGQWHPSSERAKGMMEFRLPYGAVSATNWIGMQANHYLWRYGADREVLGHIAVNTRANAGRNPEAVYRDPITMDDYLNARMVSTPLGLYDCDVPVDGAIAFVISAVETAKDAPRPPVLVEAVGTQIMERVSWDQDTLTHLPQSLGPSAHLWSRTDLTQDDVDVALLYDGFTFNALSWLEGLGFCELGGATDFIDGGRGIALDGGRLPLNPHGGQLSAGRMHGYGFVREAVLQLRGEATGRQVEGAQVAVSTAGGGIPSGAMLLRRG
ncbi:thiolase C-terminal domain-containing protein [Janibacter sp. G1551]|uniref:thiolase C-terminal domain-containing protein n=1 Tax=Janibacter sp. G1551 TaxID=3420440 RepID=UPI003CFFEE02